jgi:ABC-type oligopeptide transport system substrate-binding subunit
MWKKWKEICNKHNEKITYVNQDNYWDYTELPCKMIILVVMFLLMILLMKI